MKHLSIEELKQFPGHLIGKAWRRTSTNDDLQRHCPYDDTLIWQGAAASKEEIDSAFISARQAFYCWKNTAHTGRLAALESFQVQLKLRETALAEAISRETGKPYWESEQEVASALAKFGHTLKAWETRQKPLDTPEYSLQYHPHGILSIFGSLTFPLHLSHGQIFPALLTGNCVVFKPSATTPLSARLYGEAIIASQIPRGVINIVFGDHETARYIASHTQLDGLLFTGSSGVGLELAEQFAKTPQKILALEMEGSNPLIVSHLSKELRSSSRKAALYNILVSAFITSGQRCTCARRLIIVRSAIDNLFLEDLANLAQKLPLGSPFENPAPFYGPLVSKKAQREHLAFQKRLLSRGGYALLEGTIPTDKGPGCFVTPALIKMQAHNLIADRASFGPCLQVAMAGDLEEAIDIANETPFGLSSAVMSDREKDFFIARERLRAGIVNWNTPTTGASSHLPFGGIGHSGNFRPAGSAMIDSCAYPVVSKLSKTLQMPTEKQRLPGLQNFNQ